MDSVSDKEVGEIWERTKKDINVSDLKQSESQSEFVNSLKNKMGSITKNKTQVQNLLNKGFAERVAGLSETKSFYKPKTEKPKPVIKHVKKPITKLPANKARITKGNRLSIKKQGRFRSFNQSNVKISRYSWRGKPAISFYSIKQKKLITWGLVK